MPRFRADYDVRSSLVLPIGSEPFVLRGDNPAFELTIRNADPDGDAPDFVELGEAGIAMDDAMRRQRRVQLVG